MLKIVFTYLLLFTFLFSFAQSDTEIITFGDDNDYKERKQVETLLILKTNPLSMLSGRQFVELEMPIMDFLSIEGGTGITFKPALNSIQSFYGELIDIYNTGGCSSPNFSNEYNYCDQQDYNNFSIRETKPGIWLTGAMKFYFYNNAPDDFYISLNLRYSTSRYDVMKAKPGMLVLERDPNSFQRETIGNFDYTVRVGFQTLFSPLATDIFVGIGIRNSNATRLDIGYDPTVGEFVNATQKVSFDHLILESGVRLGFEVTKNKKSKKKKRR